ncbi:MAG: 4Fe-4S dicluster domain-containing protein [Spirochaetales bacterium]|nr:4Fe-4S dicluster domain-containing protein [Spirochaetales bacterium]
MKKQSTVRIIFNIAKCLSCRSCELACAVEHSRSKDPLKAHLEKDTPVPRRNISLLEVKEKKMCFTLTCFNCDTPLCVESCITGAMTRTGEGNVVLNTDKCIGCGMCIMVCPFGVIKQQQGEIRYMVKCDMCPDREDYACIAACPTGALECKEEEH